MGDDHWIAGAVRDKGGLHRSLGIPQGETIPSGRLHKAEHSNNPRVAKQARLAETLKHLNHKYGGEC